MRNPYPIRTVPRWRTRQPIGFPLHENATRKACSPHRGLPDCPTICRRHAKGTESPSSWTQQSPSGQEQDRRSGVPRDSPDARSPGIARKENAVVARQHDGAFVDRMEMQQDREARTATCAKSRFFRRHRRLRAGGASAPRHNELPLPVRMARTGDALGGCGGRHRHARTRGKHWSN